MVLATGNVIRPEHLGLRGEAKAASLDLPSLEELTNAHVQRVLAATAGNKTKAAEILGISKPRLYRLLEKDRPH
jgi:DNA-binding NtrC family response regulator